MSGANFHNLFKNLQQIWTSKPHWISPVAFLVVINYREMESSKKCVFFIFFLSRFIIKTTAVARSINTTYITGMVFTDQFLSQDDEDTFQSTDSSTAHFLRLLFRLQVSFYT